MRNCQVRKKAKMIEMSEAKKIDFFWLMRNSTNYEPKDDKNIKKVGF